MDETHAGIDVAVLAEAMTLFLSRRSSPYPRVDEQAVASRFGPDVASDLVPVLRALRAAFYESDAWSRARTIPEMGQLAIADFERRVGSLPPSIAHDLASDYTFNHR